MDHIVVIIVHYNTDEETKACLESLAQVKPKGYRLSALVVDNASKQPLKISQAKFGSFAEVIRSEANLGFTGGNNLGIQVALQRSHPDYFVLLNSDTLVEPTAIAKLHQSLQTHPNWGMVGPKIYFAPGYEFHHGKYLAKDKGRVIWFAGGTVDWANLTAFHRGVDEVDQGQFDQLETTDFLTGCCLMARREVIESVGGLDDRYFLYFEDVDWSLRVVAHGYQLGFCPPAVIWHKNAGSTGGSGSNVHVYYQTRNRLWFAWQYGSWRTRLTVARFGLQTFLAGSGIERRAIWDCLTGQMGKQVILQ